MQKPHIDRQGEKELISIYGTYHTKKTDTSQPTSPPPFYSKALQFIPLVAVGVALLGLLGLYINGHIRTAEWRTHTADQISSMGKKINTIVDSIQKKKIEVKCAYCYTGLMHTQYNASKKTAWDLEYDIKKNVCEINELCNCWEKIGLPGRNDFIKINNPRNGKSSWAKVIGKFKDRDNPNRALIISKKVKSDLFPGKYKSGISMQIKLVTDAKRINELNELFNNS
jgi:hypothetical protein